MPLTPKGDKILKAMQGEYGADKGKSVFYAARNKGTITGVEARRRLLDRFNRNLARRGGRA